jgi:hypothetical protein
MSTGGYLPAQLVVTEIQHGHLRVPQRRRHAAVDRLWLRLRNSRCWGNSTPVRLNLNLFPDRSMVPAIVFRRPNRNDGSPASLLLATLNCIQFLSSAYVQEMVPDSRFPSSIRPRGRSRVLPCTSSGGMGPSRSL